MPSTSHAETAPDVASPAVEPVYSGLRLVRTVAMFSIIAYHVSWTPLFGVAFGLTSLQVVMCALVARRPEAQALGPLVRKRGARLLVPWLVWSGIYALFMVGRSTRSGAEPLGWLEPGMWASGTSFHLWFLPFAFVASLLVNRAQHALRRQTADEAIALTALVGVTLVLAAGPLRSALAPPMPFDLWIDGAPTVAFGLAVGRALSLDDWNDRVSRLAFVALASTIPFLLGQGLLGDVPLYGRYAAAVPFACGGFLVRIPESRALTLFASYNLGAYLVHMLALRAVDHLPGALELAALPRTALVYGVSLAAVHVVRRLRVPYVA